MPNQALVMPLAYMLDLGYFSISTCNHKLKIVVKHLPIISMPLHPKCGAHLYEGLNMHNVLGHAHTEH